MTRPRREPATFVPKTSSAPYVPSVRRFQTAKRAG